MQIISNIALISINETLIVQLVSFLMFMFIMNFIMFRPLNRVMKKRKEYMEGLKQDAEDSDLEVENLLLEVGKHESAARNEAMAMKKELEESGSNEAAGIYADIRREVSELKRGNEKEVARQIDMARKSLGEESEQLVISIMERVLDRRVAQ